MWSYAIGGISALIVATAASSSDLRMGRATPRDAFNDPRVVKLVEAIGREDARAIEVAVNTGAGINAVGNHHTTPLHWALTKRGISVNTVKRLLELGANPNLRDEAGNSAVSLTAGSNRPDLLELFLSRGGDPNIRVSPTMTALQEAISAQNEENIRTLLKHGVNVNARNEGRNGDTVCLNAAAINRFDFVVLLLENGLTEDLERCARYVVNSVIAKGSSQNSWREKALQMIQARGVKTPAPRVTTN